GGLLGDRLIGEEADPDFTAALDEAGHRDTRRFNLAGRDPAAFHGLEAVLTERNRRAAPRLSGHASALYFAELYLFGHQHSSDLPNYSLFSPPVSGVSPAGAD